MQIAGSRCNLCDGVIISVLEAVPCEPCQVAYHRSCLPDPSSCPKCDGDFASTRQEGERQKRQDQSRQVRRGRLLVLLVIVLLFVVPVAFDLLLLALGEEVSLRRYAFISLSVLLAGFFYLGHLWARIWLTVALAFALLRCATVAFLSFLDGNLAVAFVELVILALVVWVLYLIWLARSVSLFLAYSRESTSPPS